MVFPVIMYGCESWTIKKTEHWRIDAFELWCRKRVYRFPWTARRSNWSILKEISSEYSLEGLMLKLKLHYFGHLMQRTDSFEKTLMLGRLKAGEGDDRGWAGWMASPTQWTLVWVNSGSWWWTGRPGVLQSMGSQRVRHDWATELNWGRHVSWALEIWLVWLRKWIFYLIVTKLNICMWLIATVLKSTVRQSTICLWNILVFLKNGSLSVLHKLT